MKRIFVVLVLMVMVLTMISGCAKTNGGSSQEAIKEGEAGSAHESDNKADEVEQDNDEADTVTLKFWSWYPSGDMWNDMISGFEAENPNIKIELTHLESSTYQEKLPVALATGEEVDVMAIMTNDMVNQLKTYIEPIEPLADQYMGPDWRKSYTANDIALAEDKGEGELYFIPIGKIGSPIIYYNVDMFDELGLEVPVTYEDFKRVTATIREQRPDVMPLSFCGKGTWFVDEIVWALAGQDSDIFNQIRYGDGAFTSDEYKAGVERFKQMFDDEIFGVDVLDLDYGRSLELFYSGEAAMVAQGTWEAAMLSESIRNKNGIPLNNIGAFGFPPVNDEGTANLRAYIEQGLAVRNSSEHVEEAMKFIEYMTVGGGSDYLGDNFIFTPTHSNYKVDTDSITSEEGRAGFDAMTELLNNPSSDRNNMSDLSTATGAVIVGYILDQYSSIDEALEFIQAEYETGKYK